MAESFDYTAPTYTHKYGMLWLASMDAEEARRQFSFLADLSAPLLREKWEHVWEEDIRCRMYALHDWFDQMVEQQQE